MPDEIPGGAAASDGILEFDEVTKTFGAGRRRAEALKGVGFRVRRGVVTGLIGPDAAGKTTLMRLAAGLLKTDSGRVTVLGLDPDRDPLAVQAAVGYMPQRFGLYEDLSVQENLDLYADLQGVPRGQRPDRYRELTRMTGLGPFTQRLAGRLSGGMKQKLGLACTLVRAPQLLLLDEPTVGVDPVSRRELWSIVYRLVAQEEMTVLLSTAYLDEAERCQEVVLLHHGRVLGRGTPGTFSDKVKGRTWIVSAPGLRKRELQARLAVRSGVVDAVVLAEGVRLVTGQGVTADAGTLLPGIDGVHIEAVRPRFEDGFVAELHGGSRKGSPKSATPPTSRGAPAEGAVIEVREVKRRFGDFYAVKGITFEVDRGEVFGLLGANGAGKSTTFRMLCGLLPVSAGQLRVAGVDLRRAAPAARARIGYMAQKFSLYGNLSVEQNLRFFGSAYGLSGRRRDQRTRWALEELELSAREGENSGDLPLGYKQRLSLACALLHEPDILFLDEPTSGVDPLARREFWNRINALAEAGVTVLVTTHFMEEAEYCDRLAIMAEGEILALGTPAEIRERARSEGHPEPSMEEAFIQLIEPQEGGDGPGGKP